MPEYIDITPTWGEWGNIFFLFASKGETKPVKTLHHDFARCMAMTQAFAAIKPSLTGEQAAAADSAYYAEMKKQGFEE